MHAHPRWPRVLRTAAALGALLLHPPGVAKAQASPTPEAAALLQRLDELPKQLAGIPSISSSGILTTVAHLELLGRADHTQSSQIHFQRAGDSVRADVRKLDPAGNAVDTTIWLSTPQENVYQVNADASILDPRQNPGKSFIPTYDPVGWIFSFTRDDGLTRERPLVADLASLSDPAAWQTAKQQADLQSLQKTPDGGFTITFRKTAGSAEVTFRPVRGDSATQLMPSEVRFLNPAGELIWSGKVTEWQTAGPIPTPKSAVCLTTTAIPDEKRRLQAASWTWSEVASDFRPFPENDLRFDPATATKIHHQAAETAAAAPK
ncbi:hypothetical protein TSACC_2852 [Terrimicrobium sacchariphilum]|uniref:DUF2092 domain-containing protein n=1 Tax=Terrimicrobium sacchariphilum TaxID=690879 RepID=A0A146G4U3_TERSA|nr:hypothetical protein [Terrimicrobium sacchariphilum]GAT32453.1 hypothetical protein TSACC_2852 [Terrimicrobium sacchariphilum]